MRQMSQVGFSFGPPARGAGSQKMTQEHCEHEEIHELQHFEPMASTMDLCGRKRCDPKLREALADPLVSAPELRMALADAQRRGCISKKGRERLQNEFKELKGGLDFPGVPDCVDA